MTARSENVANVGRRRDLLRGRPAERLRLQNDVIVGQESTEGAEDAVVDDVRNVGTRFVGPLSDHLRSHFEFIKILMELKPL